MSARATAWREPMLWLVVGLPALTIIAGAGLIVKLGFSGAGDAVGDEVQRISQIQQADLSPDLVARQLGLSLHLRLGEALLELRPVSGELPADASLLLGFAHPTRAEGDRTVLLQPVDGTWRAEVPIDVSHDWILRLSPQDGSWRLTGRLPRGGQSALLSPNLPSP
jgi:hypothetical protein